MDRIGIIRNLNCVVWFAAFLLIPCGCDAPKQNNHKGMSRLDFLRALGVIGGKEEAGQEVRITIAGVKGQLNDKLKDSAALKIKQIEILTFSGCDLSEEGLIENLHQVFPLTKKLFFEGSAIPANFPFEKFKRLELVSIDDSSFGKFNKREASASLKEVSVFDTRVPSQFQDWICKCQNLNELKFWGDTQLIAEKVARISRLPKLRKLDLIGNFKFNLAAFLDANSSVVDLSINGMIVDGCADRLSKLKQLKNLSLFNTRFDHRFVKQLDDSSSLESLTLGEESITRRIAKEIESLAQISVIRIVNSDPSLPTQRMELPGWSSSINEQGILSLVRIED